MKITSIKAFQIYDSRGLPTIACEVVIDGIYKGLSKIPSGASTGTKEALELRDKSNLDWNGKGVETVISNVNNIIFNSLNGFEAFKQKELDNYLIQLDGTNNKSNLGANAILAVSLAYCIACSNVKNKELYKYIREDILFDSSNDYYFPIPLINVFNGGQHSNNNIDFQEFMFIPVPKNNWKETIKVGSECFLSMQNILISKNHSIAKGDEGGFSVNLNSPYKVFDLMVESVEKAGYKIGEDVCFGLDIAASEFYKNNKYILNLDGNSKALSSQELIELYKDLINKYPIISIEDPFDENDWLSFNEFNIFCQQLPIPIQIVGDDLYCTNSNLLQEGIKQNSTSAILIKLNQIGTLSECLKTIKLAQDNNLKTIISHRSGETEDTFIVDLCIATKSNQIKTGSMSRSERLSKYNRLFYIDEIDNKLLSISFSGK